MQMQNVQNEQQQQATYINPQTYRIRVSTLSNGVINATIDVQFTANLIKELLARNVYPYCDDEEIKLFYGSNAQDAKEIIKEVAVKKALQTNELKKYYKVVLDVNDIIPTLEKLIKEREEEERRKEEERKRIREEKLKIIDQIKQKINELKQQQVIKGEYANCAYLLNGTVIYFDIGYDLERLKEELEKANSIDAYKVLRDVVEELKSENKKLNEEIKMLKNIIKKLITEEELEEKKEELEREEDELTKEEIEFLLEKVLETDEDDC